MSPKEKKGCGCLSIPILPTVALMGGGWWWLSQHNNLEIGQFLQRIPGSTSSINSTVAVTPTPLPTVTIASPTPPATSKSTPPIVSVQLPTPVETTPPPATPTPIAAVKSPVPRNSIDTKTIRGIYLSRYQVTNNASEETIRQRVRYYRSQGINTIVHGVWGNGCTMYHSAVMQKTFGFDGCPNEFEDKWLEWLIDEAHKQGMEVHAYFEKGIKIDKNSPIFDVAIAKKWIVPGIDRSYPQIEHYVLDVEVPEVASLFKNILVEFVTKYPAIDAVQWDDYLGYHAELPGKVDRTANLTKFVKDAIAGMKKANPSVKFDICHHNPYWAKRYFAADWEKWQPDRVFIQAYNNANFQEELGYAAQYQGVSIGDNQLYRLQELTKNLQIKAIFIFPLSGKPEETAAKFKQISAK